MAFDMFLLGLRGRASSPPQPVGVVPCWSEDNGPHLGAYGDGYATTPQLDALAAKGMIYLHAWSNAPVCAPARTAIISGIYPPSTGSEHMRSMTRLPQGENGRLESFDPAGACLLAADSLCS